MFSNDVYFIILFKIFIIYINIYVYKKSTNLNNNPRT